MQLFDWQHHHHLRQLSHSKFWKLEFSIWLHIFSRTLISIFVPILLLKIGYSLFHVLAYYFLLCLFNTPLNLLARRLIQKIGARQVFMLSTAAIIGFFLSLYSLQANDWGLFLILIILGALYDALYWVSHIYLFIGSNEKISKAETDTSTMYIVKQIAALLGPAIGAAILITTNSQILIATSIIFFSLSLLPLFALNDLPDRPKQPITPLKKLLATKTDRQDFFSYTIFSVHRSAELVLWPIFIYILIGTVASVAYVPIIIALTSIIFSYTVGKITQKGKERLIIIGAFFIGLIWILRLTIALTPLYYASIFFVSLLSLLISIPIDSDMFKRAKKTDALSVATWRNTFSMGIQAAVFAVLLIMVGPLKIGFVFAVISLFVLIAINSLALRRQQLFKKMSRAPRVRPTQ